MDRNKAPLSPYEAYTRILDVLDGQLAELDRAGAHKAAAHLDSAIHQLRRDRAALEIASAGHEDAQKDEEGFVIRRAFTPAFAEALPTAQVFPRKARPANSH